MALAGREIAVVGAGVGGLAAAIALARRGARVTIYEQAPEFGEAGAGIQIGPNGVAVLEALGLRAAAAAVATLPQAVELREHRAGRLVARLPLGAACVARYGRPFWQFHRADLVAVLAAGAARAGVTLRRGLRVRGARDTGRGVRLDLDGSPPAEAELVIGADGLRSTMRLVVAGRDAATPRFTGCVAWRGLAPADRLAPDLGGAGARVIMGPGRHVVAYPLRGGALWNLVAVEERAAWVAESWTMPDDPAELRSAFAGWPRPVGDLLAAIDRPYLWGLFDHPPMPAWSRGRIALIGDACHPMLPFLAQGAAMALEDAWTLAAALESGGPDLSAGLRLYEAQRKPRATRVQRASMRGGRLYHLAAPGLRDVIHLGMRAVSGLAPGAMMCRFDWLYGADVTGAATPAEARHA